MSNTVKSIWIALLVVGLISGCAAPVPTAAPTTAPTAILPSPTSASPTVAVADPAEVVQGFWEAMKTRDLDAAMTFIADDVQLRGKGYLHGKEALQFFLQGKMKSGYVFEIHDLQVEGDTVNYLADAYNTEGVLQFSSLKEVMRVQNGKIIYWEVS
jgi:limonene-1,2-epoxide hydrolase